MVAVWPLATISRAFFSHIAALAPNVLALQKVVIAQAGVVVMHRETNYSPQHVPPSAPSDNQAAAVTAVDVRRVRRQGVGEAAMRESRAAGVASVAPAPVPAPLAESGVGFGYGQQQSWRRCEELGRGAHGTVYRALVLETGESIAVKQILTSGMSRSELQVRQRRGV